MPDNLGTGGSALNAQNGSSSGSDTNDALYLAAESSPYVYLPGANGNYLSVPDSSALDITGDLDLRVRCALDDWTPAAIQILIGKREVNQIAYQMAIDTTGNVRLLWSTDGSTGILATSTAATGVADGAVKWVRATLDVNNGASGYSVQFFLSDNGTSWTQLGTTVTVAGVTSVFASTANLNVGARNSGGAEPAAGKFYRAQVLNGIGGTVVCDVNPAVLTSGSATTFTATQARVNIVPNPSFETNTTGWSSAQSSTLRSTTFAYSGTASLAVTMSSLSDSNVGATTVTAQNAADYRYSIYCYIPAGSPLAGRTISLSIEAGTATRTWSQVSATLVAGSWVRATLSATVTAPGTLVLVQRLSGSLSAAVGSVVYFDGVLLEESTTVGDYFDGASAGGSWEGTANASRSLLSGSASSTVTVNRATSGRKSVAVVSGSVWLFGTDDYMQIADNALVDFSDTQSFTVLAITRLHSTVVVNARVVDKIDSVALNGWGLFLTAAPAAQATMNGTSYLGTPTSGTITLGTMNLVGMQRDATAGDLRGVLNTSLGTANTVARPDVSNAQTVRIGIDRGGTNALAAEVAAVAIFRRVLTAAELSAVVSYYQARYP